MTKKLLNGKRIAVLAVITAIALALFIFTLPDYSVEGAGGEEIFLKERQTIAVDWNIDSDYGEQNETAHHMGSEFLIEFIFQYDHDRVDLDTDSLRNISFKPFDVVQGTEPQISEREITDEVHEARYSAHVRFVQVNPGNSYNMEESKVEYIYVRTGTKYDIDATPPHSFQVSTYCGSSPQTCEFRTLSDTLEDNIPLFALILQTAGGVSLLAPLALVVFWARRREGRMANKDSDLETEELIELYRQLVAPALAPPETARSYIRQLQGLSYKMANHFFGVHPKDFWESEEDSWQALYDGLDAKSKPGLVGPDDIEEVRKAMKDVFGAEVHKRQKNYKKVISFFSRTKEER